MSRLAAAFRKTRGATSAAVPFSGDVATEWESFEAIEVPWDLGAPPPGVAEPHAPAERSALIGDVRARSLVDSHGVSQEQLARLVQRLLQAGAGQERLRSVLFAAVGTGVAAEQVCAAAAEAVASQTTASVCLVDGDLRSPALHESFRRPGARGFSDLLLQSTDLRACLTQLRPNLCLLPAGSRGSEALPHLGQHAGPLLSALLATFDYAIIHTSPASAHGDAALLGPLVDGVVLVLEAGTTRREVARRTAEHLQAAHANLLGAVLTNRTFPIPESIYRRL